MEIMFFLILKYLDVARPLSLCRLVLAFLLYLENLDMLTNCSPPPL